MRMWLMFSNWYAWGMAHCWWTRKKSGLWSLFFLHFFNTIMLIHRFFSFFFFFIRIVSVISFARNWLTRCNRSRIGPLWIFHRVLSENFNYPLTIAKHDFPPLWPIQARSKLGNDEAAAAARWNVNFILAIHAFIFQ